jgi:hypothetical protein
MKQLILVLCLTLILCNCTHIHPQKFDVKNNVILRKGEPVAIKTNDFGKLESKKPTAYPKHAKFVRYTIEHFEMFQIFKELMTKELAKSGIEVNDQASKVFYVNLKRFEIKLPGLFTFLTYAHVYYQIYLSNGYVQDYKVTDQSPVAEGRALGGAISRAVEAIFLDHNVQDFLEQ